MKLKKKKTLVILLIIFLIIFIYFVLKNNSKLFKDDIIFFKNFYTSRAESKSKETYDRTYFDYNNIIEISTKKQNTKELSLFSNLTNETNWNKIIYPGTKGNFSIMLYGKENLKYQIIFKSKNPKPENLVFKESGREYKTLEDLGKNLIGSLQKAEIKEIIIEWEWKYQTNKNQDIQDTIDGKEIKEYNFEIIAKGEEI